MCGSPTSAGGGHSQSGQAILFSQAPTTVQSGIETLATTDGVTAPTDSTSVKLANSNGIETYSITITGIGTRTTLTVDANGNPVTAPTVTTRTWATLNGTDTGSNTAAATEISTIASVLGLSIPADTDSVTVMTKSDGTSVYTVRLVGTSSKHGTLISVDSDGNPVGSERIPFSVLPTAIQNGLIAAAPSTSTLTSSSTTMVNVWTSDGVTTYSVIFTSTGTISTVTVDKTGTLISLPTRATTTFDQLTSAAQTEIQTLATADGVTDTIATSQSVTMFTETNGTVVYSVRLTASSGASVVISVDANGNPTVPADDSLTFALTGAFGGGGNGCGGSGGSTTTTSGGSTNSTGSTNSGTTTTVSGSTSKTIKKNSGKKSKSK